MRNKPVRAAIVWAALVVVVYVSTAFVQWAWNPGEWHPAARFVVGFFSGGLALMTAATVEVD